MSIKLILTIVEMAVKLAELIFNKPKSGAEKKSYVTNIAKAFAGDMEIVSEGGQKETWTTISDVVDNHIEKVVSEISEVVDAFSDKNVGQI